MREFFQATSADPEATWPYKMDKTRGYEENRLVTGMMLANRRIFEAAQRENRLHGMGTTMVACAASSSSSSPRTTRSSTTTSR
jgi:protein phosphatase